MRFTTSIDAPWPGNFRDFNAAVVRMATLASGGRVTLAGVQREIERLESDWRGADSRPEDDLLERVLGGTQLDELDRFDRVQLAEVLSVCAQTRTLSEAGRVLFAASRARRKTVNDADRVRKYLARFDLSWHAVREVVDTPRLGEDTLDDDCGIVGVERQISKKAPNSSRSLPPGASGWVRSGAYVGDGDGGIDDLAVVEVVGLTPLGSVFGRRSIQGRTVDRRQDRKLAICELPAKISMLHRVCDRQFLAGFPVHDRERAPRNIGRFPNVNETPPRLAPVPEVRVSEQCLLFRAGSPLTESLSGALEFPGCAPGYEEFGLEVVLVQFGTAEFASCLSSTSAAADLADELFAVGT